MKILFVSDLDGTLIGVSQALKDLNVYINELKQQVNFVLCYSTGRSPSKYKELKTTEPLMVPDYLITGFGSKIYIEDNFDKMLEDWPFIPNGAWDRQEIVYFLKSKEDSVRLQEPSEQLDHKISYYGEIGKNYDNLKIAVENKFPLVELLVSHNGEYIDVMPKEINKVSAVKYLENLTKADLVICAGDSLNDYSMLKSYNSIIPGNAYPELKNSKFNNAFYLAKNNYAAGVLEGLMHYLKMFKQ